MGQPTETAEDTEQPFLSHLIELRARLLRSLLCIVVLALCLVPFANDIYAFIARPLLRQLPSGATMIATAVTSPFVIPFKLTLFAALLLSLPYVLYQVWAFVAPGLYRHERRLVLPLIIASTALFFLGLAFAYFAVFPVVFAFFAASAPAGVTVATDIAAYLDFVLMMFLAFGVSFQVPIAVLLVVRAGLVSVATISAQRPYVIVGAFIVGAVLTPPDVLSQTMLAVPLWLLFEAGLLFSRFIEVPSAARDT